MTRLKKPPISAQLVEESTTVFMSVNPIDTRKHKILNMKLKEI
jgi:hypothetical protein